MSLMVITAATMNRADDRGHSICSCRLAPPAWMTSSVYEEYEDNQSGIFVQVWGLGYSLFLFAIYADYPSHERRIVIWVEHLRSTCHYYPILSYIVVYDRNDTRLFQRLLKNRGAKSYFYCSQKLTPFSYGRNGLSTTNISIYFHGDCYIPL